MYICNCNDVMQECTSIYHQKVYLSAKYFEYIILWDDNTKIVLAFVTWTCRTHKKGVFMTSCIVKPAT